MSRSIAVTAMRFCHLTWSGLATVEPKLRVVRADKITQPGMITKQVLEYLLKS